MSLAFICFFKFYQEARLFEKFCVNETVQSTKKEKRGFLSPLAAVRTTVRHSPHG